MGRHRQIRSQAPCFGGQEASGGARNAQRSGAKPGEAVRGMSERRKRQAAEYGERGGRADVQRLLLLDPVVVVDACELVIRDLANGRLLLLWSEERRTEEGDIGVAREKRGEVARKRSQLATALCMLCVAIEAFLDYSSGFGLCGW